MLSRTNRYNIIYLVDKIPLVRLKFRLDEEEEMMISRPCTDSFADAFRDAMDMLLIKDYKYAQKNSSIVVDSEGKIQHHSELKTKILGEVTSNILKIIFYKKKSSM